jgi:hypothetical protein
MKHCRFLFFFVPTYKGLRTYFCLRDLDWRDMNTDFVMVHILLSAKAAQQTYSPAVHPPES